MVCSRTGRLGETTRPQTYRWRRRSWFVGAGAKKARQKHNAHASRDWGCCGGKGINKDFVWTSSRGFRTRDCDNMRVRRKEQHHKDPEIVRWVIRAANEVA